LDHLKGAEFHVGSLTLDFESSKTIFFFKSIKKKAEKMLFSTVQGIFVFYCTSLTRIWYFSNYCVIRQPVKFYNQFIIKNYDIEFKAIYIYIEIPN
jgi:hypothetical protein